MNDLVKKLNFSELPVKIDRTTENYLKKHKDILRDIYDFFDDVDFEYGDDKSFKELKNKIENEFAIFYLSRGAHSDKFKTYYFGLKRGYK